MRGEARCPASSASAPSSGVSSPEAWASDPGVRNIRGTGMPCSSLFTLFQSELREPMQRGAGHAGARRLAGGLSGEAAISACLLMALLNSSLSSLSPHPRLGRHTTQKRPCPSSEPRTRCCRQLRRLLKGLVADSLVRRLPGQ